MDAAQWSQEVGMVKQMEESSTNPTSKAMMLERKLARPQKDQALNCPRCNSTNTKFCYYNNYSLTQPRYFCKTCRRYWTAGGSLRNVPVGGGSRKNKRASSTISSSSLSSSHKLPDLNPPISLSNFSSSQNPNPHQGHDLNLAFPHAMQDYLSISQFVEFPKIQNNNISSSSSTSSSSTNSSALELLRAGISTSRGLHSFIPTPMPADSNAPYGTTLGFHLQEMKPNLSFSIDGGSLMYPFGGVKQVSSASGVDHQSKGQGNSNGYWNGMLGGGSW